MGHVGWGGWDGSCRGGVVSCRGGVCHVGVGWSVSCRGGVGHAGGWGGSCRGGVGVGHVGMGWVRPG